jgi:hypothetical protein
MMKRSDHVDSLRQAFVEAKREYEKRLRGLYEKFIVLRSDERDAPGQKHHGCKYFVLDLTCDPHAIPAIRAYAESCRQDGYGVLADDLEARAKRLESGDSILT